MAESTTAKFEQLTLDVETATVGTYATVAGLLDITVTRTANVDTTETPDAVDESQPLYIDKEVRSLDVKVDCTGVWAQESNAEVMNWFYSGSTKNIKVTNAAALTGDPSIEAGPALLVSVKNMRSKGKKLTADLSIEFTGRPTLTNAA